MSENQVRPYPLRLEPELKKQLEELAKANGRSLNSEIAIRLDLSVNTPNSNDETELDKKIRAFIKEELAKNK